MSTVMTHITRLHAYPADPPVRLVVRLVQAIVKESRAMVCVISRGWDQLAHVVAVDDSTFSSFPVKVHVVPIRTGYSIQWSESTLRMN